MSPTYEVYAIRYATLSGRMAHQNYLSADPHESGADLDYFVWLIRGGGQDILVDTGFGDTTSIARNRKLTIHPLKALAMFGVQPESIKQVIVTHLHYDHAGNLDRFPEATFHLQEREMAFATGRCMCHGFTRHPFSVEDVTEMVRHVYADRVVFYQGDGEVAPGITVHHVGGHTDGLQVVRVNTRRGPLVLASDAAHYYDNFRLGKPFPILFDVGAMERGWKTLESLAGERNRIIPGHDPAVALLYGRVHEQLDIFALHLDPLKPH